MEGCFPIHVLSFCERSVLTLQRMEPEVKMRKKRKQKKAPEAPKKALTAYIFFSKEMRPRIKATMDPETKVWFRNCRDEQTTEIVRIIAEKWSAMTDEEKAPYRKLAEDDKVRYNQEISNYDGPLHIPVTRKRGHQIRAPVGERRGVDGKGAPKRAMSAFLYFSNSKRQEMQRDNPDMKITAISAKLGEIWREMTDEEKEPYVKKSKEDRDRYHKEQEVFKTKNEQPAAVGELLGSDGKEPVATVSAPIQTVVASNQWNMQIGETGSNQLYSRPYEISSQTNSFTNISIPTGFNRR